MTLNEAIMQLVEMRENSMMPDLFKPYFDKVIETISECAEPSEIPHWIPRSERMPEKPGEYFCCWQGKTVSMGMFLNGHFRLFGENKDNLVTAWMPLPQPYMGGKQDD